jgi:hypothetical protein
VASSKKILCQTNLHPRKWTGYPALLDVNPDHHIDQRRIAPVDIPGFLNGFSGNFYFYTGGSGYSLFSGIKDSEMDAFGEQYSFSLLASAPFAHTLS